MATHTIDLLEHAISVAKKAEVKVRSDWFDGLSGGLCRIGNQKWLFLDVSLSVADQLNQVTTALRQLSLDKIEMHPDLRKLVA